MQWLLVVCFASFSIFANNLDLIKYSTLQGQFWQKNIISGETIDKRKGRFYIKDSGESRWEINVDSKFKKILLTTNKQKLMMVDPQLEQIVFHDYKDIPLLKNLVMFDFNNAQQEFIASSLANQGHLKVFKLLPKQASVNYEYVLLYIDNGLVSKIKIYRGSDEAVLIEFSNVKVDEFIDSNKFIFVIPKNYDVVKSKKANEL